MKFWEVVKNLYDKEFEIVGETDDDTDFTFDIVEIQKKTKKRIVCETPETTISLDKVRKSMTNLGLKETPGMYIKLKKQAGIL